MSGGEDSQRWIKEVMSGVIESLGSNVEEVEYEVNKPTDFFMSTLYHVCVKFKSKTNEGQNEELFVVLKRPIQVKLNRDLVLIDPQFHNEILFYRTYVKPDDNFPRCLYTDENPPVDSVIAMENVMKRGYCPPPSPCDVSLDYILAAIREIAWFHAKGYVMKELQSDKFFDIVRQLQESKFDMSQNESTKLYINFPANRSVEYLRNQGYDAIFCDKMDAVLHNAFDAATELAQPVEPLATLCHGDFTLNNILFKTENDGRLRPMLIDFALLRYSTPVIDLSTFLYLSCTNEFRKDHFFDIMRVYHDTLKKHLLDAGVQNIDKYSYDAILDDFKRGALVGFIIASFFLPVLIGYVSNEMFDKRAKGEISEMEYLKFNRQGGGEKMSKILADMLLQLKDFGCLKHIL